MDKELLTVQGEKKSLNLSKIVETGLNGLLCKHVVRGKFGGMDTGCCWACGCTKARGHQATAPTTGTAPSNQQRSALSAFQIYAEFRDFTPNPQTQAQPNAGQVQPRLQIQQSTGLALTKCCDLNVRRAVSLERNTRSGWDCSSRETGHRSRTRFPIKTLALISLLGRAETPSSSRQAAERPPFLPARQKMSRTHAYNQKIIWCECCWWDPAASWSKHLRRPRAAAAGVLPPAPSRSSGGRTDVHTLQRRVYGCSSGAFARRQRLRLPVISQELGSGLQTRFTSPGSNLSWQEPQEARPQHSPAQEPLPAAGKMPLCHASLQQGCF